MVVTTIARECDVVAGLVPAISFEDRSGIIGSDCGVTVGRRFAPTHWPRPGDGKSIHRFRFARPLNGFSFSRGVRRIGVPGRSKASRSEFVR